MKISRKTHIVIWAALMVLLFATWGFSELNLEPLNLMIAMTISISKMVLIILYFMHVRYSPRLIWVFVAAGFVWLLIFIDLTMSDYLTREFTWVQW